jgi:hypothetical protein
VSFLYPHFSSVQGASEEPQFIQASDKRCLPVVVSSNNVKPTWHVPLVVRVGELDLCSFSSFLSIHPGLDPVLPVVNLNGNVIPTASPGEWILGALPWISWTASSADQKLPFPESHGKAILLSVDGEIDDLAAKIVRVDPERDSYLLGVVQLATDAVAKIQVPFAVETSAASVMTAFVVLDATGACPVASLAGRIGAQIVSPVKAVARYLAVGVQVLPIARKLVQSDQVGIMPVLRFAIGRPGHDVEIVLDPNPRGLLKAASGS